MVNKRELFKECIGVAIGGGFGTLARFFVTYTSYTQPFPTLPAIPLFINLTGSLVAGVLYFLLREKLSLFYKAMLFIGFLGSYTTFSAFSFETNNFIIHKYFALAISNILISLLGCLFSFAFGYILSKKISAILKRNVRK